jgi:hypothetical protein
MFTFHSTKYKTNRLVLMSRTPKYDKAARDTWDKSPKMGEIQNTRNIFLPVLRALGTWREPI